MISNEVKDIYHIDDTLWTYKDSKIVANIIANKACDNQPAKYFLIFQISFANGVFSNHNRSLSRVIKQGINQLKLLLNRST